MRTNRNRIEFLADRVLRYPITSWDLQALPTIAARHEAARALGLPVPKVLAVRSDHLVLQRMPGTPSLSTRLDHAAQRRLGRQVAEALAVLRATHEWPLPTSPPWPQLWAALCTRDPAQRLVAAADTAATVPLSPMHGDLSGGNLLVDDRGNLTGILDWDGVCMGDPAVDFAAVCVNLAPRASEALCAATPEAAELHRRAGAYLATWPLQNRLWEQGRHPWVAKD